MFRVILRSLQSVSVPVGAAGLQVSEFAHAIDVEFRQAKGRGRKAAADVGDVVAKVDGAANRAGPVRARIVDAASEDACASAGVDARAAK